MADIENKLVDKRVAHRYVRKGKLDEKDYEKHIKTLPDLADLAVPVEASIDSDDLDDLDDDDLDDDELDDETDDTDEGEAPEGGTPQP